jgi:hypothetical protein
LEQNFFIETSSLIQWPIVVVVFSLLFSMLSQETFEEERWVTSSSLENQEFLPSPDSARLVTATASPKYLMRGGGSRPVAPQRGRKTCEVDETLLAVVKGLRLGLYYAELGDGEFDESSHIDCLHQLSRLGPCSAETVEVYDQVVHNIRTRLMYWAEDDVMNSRVRLSRPKEEKLVQSGFALSVDDWAVQDLIVEAVLELRLDQIHTFVMPSSTGALRWLRKLEQARPLADAATRHHLDQVLDRIR